MALYISTLICHNDRAGFIDEPKTSSSLRKKNVPLSADDGHIHRALTLEGCEIQGLFREKLRVDGKLTNCETGACCVLVCDMLCTQSFGQSYRKCPGDRHL
jgi:hypothetical protein